MRTRTFVRFVLLGSLVVATAASAEILVMRGPNGQLYLTNRGEKSGYKVISRHREFFGSSGMGLRSRRGGDPTKYDEAVRKAAAEHSLDPHLVKAVIRAESNFDPMATSVKGAMGLMQLMPDTARMHGVKNAYDPLENIGGGVRHLRYLMTRYESNLDLVLAAYNAGTKPVDAVKGIPAYAETREYVRRVREFHAHYDTAQARLRPASVKPVEVLENLDLGRKSLEEIYGVPIVLHAPSGL